ncbi:MAG: TlpA family protein disulfide reductase [Gemmatimonadetes bacterium]|nr:TlpA family protein disulfide reductase [Gemmatimonadota bacterium]
MSERRQWALVIGISVALGVGLWAVTVRLGDELFPLQIGGDAPDFAALPVAAPTDAPAPTTGGPGATGAAPTPPVREVKGIDDYTGDVVLLNIWATWCGPCRVEMPSMQRLQERLGPKGLRIVAVSVDDPGKAGDIRGFAQELGLTFELLHDPTKAIERTYQTTGVPETFLIGRDGTIRRRSIGAEAWDSEANVAQLERLLAEPRP